MKKSFKIKIIVAITILSAIFMIYEYLKTFSIVTLLYVIISLLSLLGLILNKKWCKYLFLLLSTFISINCFFYLIAEFSNTQFSNSFYNTLFLLLPIIALLAVFWGISIIVFKHFDTSNQIMNVKCL